MKSVFTNTAPKYTETNPLSPRIPHLVQDTKMEFVDAIVVDVINDEDHPDYAMDGYNIGCIKFRAMGDDHFRGEDKLNWAFPDDGSFSSFPLKNEFVRVYKALNRFYYIHPLNLGKGSSNQAMYGIDPEMQTIPLAAKKIDLLEQSMASPNVVSSPESILGRYFKEKVVRRLRRWEGDHIIEGRSGQSIRLGTSWKDPKIHKDFVEAVEQDQSPNMLIRVGAWEEAPVLPETSYGRITEDVNKDANSLWIVTDQIVKLEPATKDTPEFHKSIREYPQRFDGAQEVLNTDRFILNTKKNEVLVFGTKGIHFGTKKDFTVDTTEDYFSWIGRDSLIDVNRNRSRNVVGDGSYWYGGTYQQSAQSTYTVTAGGKIRLSSRNSLSIFAPKIYLGMENSESEPMVLGETLRNVLISIIDAHLNSSSVHVITSMGPGKLNPAVEAKLRQIKSQLGSKNILSNSNFVTKNNSSPLALMNKLKIHP